LAERVLEKMGHTVTVVENGRQAVEMVRERPFDLVLMDVQMPVMDGFEATALIREDERKDAAAGRVRRTPIVAMTAHAMSSDRQQCLQAGMDGYLSKPIVLKDLAETVRRLALKDQARPLPV
jgi:CheY-like chemotaxis protein